MKVRANGLQIEVDEMCLTLIATHQPVAADLRFLVGLTVSISSMNEGRAKALFEKARAAGASTVAACHHIQAIHTGCKSGWTQIHHAQE